LECQNIVIFISQKAGFFNPRVYDRIEQALYKRGIRESILKRREHHGRAKGNKGQDTKEGYRDEL
jgi:hypothetical protein